MRWLKRWRYIQLIKGVKFKEQIENERNERDKKLHEREYQEYGNVEKAFREGRKRAAELFEKSLEVLVKKRVNAVILQQKPFMVERMVISKEQHSKTKTLQL